jgi:hypothetical protein
MEGLVKAIKRLFTTLANQASGDAKEGINEI